MILSDISQIALPGYAAGACSAIVQCSSGTNHLFSSLCTASEAIKARIITLVREAGGGRTCLFELGGRHRWDPFPAGFFTTSLP